MPPNTPTSSGSQYDFILRGGQQAKKRLPIPNLPKPVLWAIAAAAVVLVMVFVSSIISKSKQVDYSPLVGAVSEAVEIQRVSTEAESGSHDYGVQNLASTIVNTLASNQKDLTDYLSGRGVQLSAAQINADKSANTDNQLKVAAASGLYDSSFISYLQVELAKYQTDLAAGYKIVGPNGKAILNSDTASLQILIAYLQNGFSG